MTKAGQPLSLTVLGNTDMAAGPEFIGSELTKLGATVKVETPDAMASRSAVVARRSR